MPDAWGFLSVRFEISFQEETVLVQSSYQEPYKKAFVGFMGLESILAANRSEAVQQMTALCLRFLIHKTGLPQQQTEGSV